MISTSSYESVSVDSGPSETQRLLQSRLCRSGQQKRKTFCTQCLLSLKCICLLSKPVCLILIWTLIVSIVTAIMLSIAVASIGNSVGFNPFSDSNPITSPFCITHAVLAFTAMLYPVSGFLADVWCGRFKAVMIGLSCLLFATILPIITLIWFSTRYNRIMVPIDEAALFYVIGVCVGPFILVGLAAYYANFIQLGLDQLMEESSMHLSLFAHWAIWMELLGTATVAVGASFLNCHTFTTRNTKYAILSVPCLILLSFPFVLVFSCWKHRWFIAHPAQHNPYKTVIKVLNFARIHQWPLRRSAFTYCDDEKPSRIDFAKERYGGPFTTEQVEDVKTFLQVFGLLLSLGPLLIMDSPSSFMGFTIFGLHTGFLEDFIHRCYRWVFLDSGALKYMIGTLFLPCYILFHFSILKQKTKMLTRLWIGLFLYFLGLLSMLIINLVGHLHSVNDQGIGDYCMFTYTRLNGSLLYPVLELHWTVLLPPNILLGIGPPIVLITILEFISAQSPQSMKGLLIGLFFAIKGIFELVSTIVLFLFSTNTIWAGRHVRAVTNCGFGYLLFTCVAALVGLVLFSVVARRYKYRERDDRPYDHSQIEEIFYRRLEINSYST